MRPQSLRHFSRKFISCIILHNSSCMQQKWEKKSSRTLHFKIQRLQLCDCNWFGLNANESQLRASANEQSEWALEWLIQTTKANLSFNNHVARAYRWALICGLSACCSCDDQRLLWATFKLLHPFNVAFFFFSPKNKSYKCEAYAIERVSTTPSSSLESGTHSDSILKKIWKISAKFHAQ